MPGSRLQHAVSFLVLGIALAWSVASAEIKAAMTPDRDGCPHSSDLARAGNAIKGRAAVLCLVNHERVGRGLAPLIEDPRLESAAQAHADDMGRRNFYAHVSPDGLDADRRMRAAGYDGQSTGENIHWGVGVSATPARIVEDWMNSPGHRANILRPSFTRIGTGVAYDAPDSLVLRGAGVYVNNFGG